MSVIRLFSRVHSILLFVFLFLGVLGSGEAYAAVCDDGRSVPPYVGTDAVDPNVLLMIDNSASMNDLAAVGSTGICYDGPDDAGGGYNSSNNYPGYFRPYVDPDDPAMDPYLEDAWYSYDLVDGRFEKMLDTNNDQDNEPEARALCGTTGKVFSGDDVCVKYNPEYTGPGDTDPPVLAFAARGNFLNWLSASKFDIQKKVLTGGKVNESNNELELIMESRGCLNHRYVKKTVGVDLTGDITGLGANSEAYLTLGIRIPAEWQNGISYPANSIVVTPPGCREDNTVECVGYYTSAGGTSSGTSPQNDSVTWEERDYADLTQIEVFKVTTTGFDVSGCELAIAEMAKPSPNLGQIKADIDVCLETVGGLTTLEAASNAIFNQSTQDCWYMQKHSDLWDTMGDDATINTENMANILQGCQAVYEALEAQNKTLTDITPTDTGYACYGYNYLSGDESVKGGYVGRCWEQASTINCEEETCPAGMPESGAERICRGGIVYECPDNNWKGGQCKSKGDIIPEEKYTVSVVCTGLTAPGNWEKAVIHPDTGTRCLDLYPEPSFDSHGNCISDSDGICINCLGGKNELNGCIQQAIEDYCGNFTTQEVIDPSDVEGSVSGDYYNIPAILIETAVNAQLDESLMAMNGRIQTDVVPEGILEQNAAEFRFGAMAFNDKGQKTECQLAGQDSVVVRDCSDASKDGARVIAYLAGKENIEQLTGSINAEKATTWTPLAEAMYTAIGYYSQDPEIRLNPSDFVTQAEVDSATVGDAPGWVNTANYSKNDMVTHGGNTYIAVSAGTSCENCSGPEDDNMQWLMVQPGALPAEVDPVEYHCQSNNVIYITEGASTVDVAPEVASFVQANNDSAENNDDLYSDSDPTTTGDTCGKFNGSTYLDDLAWYGWQGNMWSGKDGKENYSNIRSWIVESATRVIEDIPGDSECQPPKLLSDAAINGSWINESSYTEKFEAAGNELLFRIRLQSAFDAIKDQVSSGSAASVISASRSGEGALYQAIFWPDKDTGKINELTGKPITVKWTGEVHAFLVDSQGTLYMDDCKDDTEGCQTGGLDEPYDSDGDFQLDTFLDTPVIVYGDEIGQTDSSGSGAQTTKGCPGTLINGEIVFFNEAGTCLKTPMALEHIEYLWSTSEWLNRSAVEEIGTIEYNRSIVDLDSENNPADVNELKFRFDSDNSDQRFIFTWNDLDNDGVVDYDNLNLAKHELRDFEAGLPVMGSLASDSLPDVAKTPGVDLFTRGPVPLDFGVNPRAADAETKVTNIINWVRGKTVAGMRDRQVPFDKNEDGTVAADEYAVWKLGDVIHSTPVSVSAPAENYHLLYRDQTYRDFAARWQNRRHMIYFGANDGMLHAINGGFFNQLESRFCRDQDCVSTSNTPRLGAEMWAYVPYNLLPHLSCLTDPGYGLEEHKYFVDLRPRIFDVQIFDKNEAGCSYVDGKPTTLDDPGCIHPNGWGTILVGGMRFGGSKVRPGKWEDDDGDGVLDAGEDTYADTSSVFHGNGFDYDNREFTSAYFIFDITDPERVPTLLGEFTRKVEDIDSDGVGDTSAEVELGYTTVIPTMVPMKVSAESADLNGDGTIVESEKEDKNCDTDTDDPAISKWYLALGSGPTEPELDGTSSRNGSVSIIPLDRLVSKDSGTDPKKDMRIPAVAPVATGIMDDPEETEYGTITLPDGNSFISDMITVDMELNKDYLADVMYFGTISGDWYDNGGWGGKMYRLVTREECSGTGKQRFAAPDEWNLRPLLNAGKPITSSPTVGTDGTDFWVYFGTGRFFHDLDKEDSSSNALQTFYGIREPVADDTTDCGSLTWAEVLNKDATDSMISPLFPYEITTNGVFPAARGTLGLLPVGDIGVLSSPPGYQDLPNTLICKGDTGEYLDTLCLPSTVLPTATVPYPGTRSFRDLVYTITGTSRNCGTGTMGTDGWYRDFPDDRERNLGQATLFGALLNYTTYQPYNDICVAEGLSSLYSVYYQTGTAWVEDIFGNVGYDPEARQVNPDRVDLGKGLTTTPSLHSGTQEGQKVFIQTSTGRIVEIPQPNLPEKQVKSGRIKWRDIEQ